VFELVKRDGHREEYNWTKLARSLTRAGVAPNMLAEVMINIGPGPVSDTGSLRARVESELALREPGAARRYAATCSLTARGSGQALRGRVCLNPETARRLSLGPGDTVRLSHNGTEVPFSVEILGDVALGQAWLNRREMAAMRVSAGTRLAASGACLAAPPTAEVSLACGCPCVVWTSAAQSGTR
jgi:hypothetical protein